MIWVDLTPAPELNKQRFGATMHFPEGFEDSPLTTLGSKRNFELIPDVGNKNHYAQDKIFRD